MSHTIPCYYNLAMGSQRAPLLAALMLLLAGAFRPANAQLTITPTYDSSLTSLQNSAEIEASIQTDINTLENYITTNAPVTDTIDFQNMDSGLGENNSPTMDIPYSTYLSDLQANPQKATNDLTALATMPAANVGIRNDAPVSPTAANLAAIGDTADASTLVSGNGGFDWVRFCSTSRKRWAGPWHARQPFLRGFALTALAGAGRGFAATGRRRGAA